MVKNNLLRITQINVIYLDREIQKAFHQIIQAACKHLPPGSLSLIDGEITLLVNLGILKYSLLDNGSTFGQQLLNVKYDNVSTSKRFLYVVFSCMDYIKARLELWNPSHGINNFISKSYVLLKILDFINTSVFLKNGVKPLLIERILGLDQVYASEELPRTFESKYLARELLWNGFIEILVYVLPLINYSKLKRLTKQYNPFYIRRNYSSVMSSRIMTIQSKCAHCGQNPILPHHMGCQHIFCYICLKGNQTADSRYECPVCEHSNPNLMCERVGA